MSDEIDVGIELNEINIDITNPVVNTEIITPAIELEIVQNEANITAEVIELFFEMTGTNIEYSKVLKIDQSDPQEIINGIPLLNETVDPDGSDKQLVNKEYVDGSGNPFDFLQLKTDYTPTGSEAVGTSYWDSTKDGPTWKTDDGLKNLRNYAELAIPTTQNALYTDLIPNNKLIPNQWYLITDFKGEYQIPDTSPYEFHTGLVATFYNQNGNSFPQYYDDGVTPIVDGDPEQIYVLASSTNTIYPIGHSKTFKDEEITFQQNITPLTDNDNLYIQGYEQTEYYMPGDGNNSDGTLNNYESGLTIDTVIDSSNIIVGGTGADFILDRVQNGSFSFNITDGNGTTINYIDSDYNINWSYNPATHILTDLTGSMDFTTLGYGGHWNGYMQYQPSYTGTVTYPPFYGSARTYITEIIDSSHIRLGGDYLNIVNRIKNGNFYIIFCNNALGQNIYFTDTNENIDWSLDPNTGIFTDLAGTYDFTRLTSNYCYSYGYWNYAVKTFQGQIVQRRNLKLNVLWQADYRSTLQKRYKAQISDWSDGTYNQGTFVRREGFIYECVRTTTSVPQDHSPYWLRLFDDGYYMSRNMSLGYTALNIDSANYIYTSCFDLNVLKTLNKSLNVTFLNVGNYLTCDVVIFGSITGFLNCTVKGSALSIYNTCSNSSVNAINSVIGDTQFANIYYMDSSYLGDVIRSNVALSQNSIVRSILNSNIFDLSNNSIDSISSATIARAYNTFAQYIQLTTAQLLSNVYCAGYILNNNVTNISDCNFYNDGSQSVFGNFIMSSLQNANIQGPFFGNNIFGETRFINISGSIINNTFYNNVYTINKYGNSDNTDPLNITISDCTFRGGVDSWSGLGTADISNTEFDTGSSGINFRIGGTTNIRNCKLYNIRNSNFATYGTVTWVGLTTYADSYSNNFHAMRITNCRIGSFFNNSFGGTGGAYVNLYNSTISANISSCNADYVAIGALNSSGLLSLQVSGGNSQTYIIDNQVSGVLGPITMNAGSKLTSCVFNGIAQNITIDANGQISSCIFTSTTSGMRVYTGIQLNTVNFYGVQSVQFTYNVQRTSFFKLLSSTTTPYDISNLTCFGDFTDGWVMSAGIMYQIGSGRETKNYISKTANYTLAASDYLVDCNNTFTITLLSAVTAKAGAIYHIKNSGTGIITINTTSSQTIDGVTTKTLTQYQILKVMSNGSNRITI